MKKKSGFTLVEMIISMLLMSILVVGVSMLIAKPMEAYARASTQQRLYQQGEYLLNRITRDVQNAVPNSIRISALGGDFLELVPVLAAVRYRTTGPGALTFSAPQSSFNILQDYTTLSATLYASGTWFLTNNPDPAGVLSSISPPADPLAAGLPFRLIIYNTGQYTSSDYNYPIAGLNVYNPAPYEGTDSYPPVGSHVVTPANVGVIFTDAGGGETTLSLIDRGTGNPYPMQFAIPSPKNILYITDSPVTYYCNKTNGSYGVSRHRDYPFSQRQPLNSDYDPDSVLPQDPFWNPGYGYVWSPNWVSLKRTLQFGLTNCSFTYEVEPGQNTALLTVRFTLTELNLGNYSITTGGESIDVFRQIQVKNVL